MMDQVWQRSTVFLGAGGRSPRVEAMNAGLSETREIIGLPMTHSVYAVEFNWDTGLLAAGTKGWLIHIIDTSHIQELDEAPPHQTLIQGAPVLSVCWVNQSILAVSDTAGRCFLWHMNQEMSPQPLEVIEGVICSLLCLPDGRLSGLSSDGKLLFWSSPEGKLVGENSVSPPPPMGALVRMVYWPAEQALVCPGSEGLLSLYYLDKNDVRALDAHEGPVYAISVWGENLMTVGVEDHHLKIWVPGSEKPSHVFQVSNSVISLGVIGDLPVKILLVDTQGKAGIYTLELDKLKSVKYLNGKDYRVVATPAAEQMQAFNARRRAEEVHNLLKEIEEGVGRLPSDAIDSRHARLKKLGYEHVSLALRVEQAIQSGKIVEALGLSSSLVSILPHDHPNVCPSMEKNATLLEKTWHLPEAEAVCRQIQGIEPNYSLILQPDDLAGISKLMKNTNWLIEPDIPISRIIESATIIGKRFSGRYVIKRLNPEPCGRVKLSCEVIAKKYEQVRKEKKERSLPRAIIERVWWFSRGKRNRIDLVTVGRRPWNDIEGLQFVLNVWQGSAGTVVVPFVIFDWSDFGFGQSVEEGNQRASIALSQIGAGALSNLYLGAIHNVLEHALRRLLTENLSQRESQR